jgi:hypothetical protein
MEEKEMLRNEDVIKYARYQLDKIIDLPPHDVVDFRGELPKDWELPLNWKRLFIISDVGGVYEMYEVCDTGNVLFDREVSILDVLGKAVRERKESKPAEPENRMLPEELYLLYLDYSYILLFKLPLQSSAPERINSFVDIAFFNFPSDAAILESILAAENIPYIMNHPDLDVITACNGATISVYKSDLDRAISVIKEAGFARNLMVEK